jgi:hypothetical protein
MHDKADFLVSIIRIGVQTLFPETLTKANIQMGTLQRRPSGRSEQHICCSRVRLTCSPQRLNRADGCNREVCTIFRRCRGFPQFGTQCNILPPSPDLPLVATFVDRFRLTGTRGMPGNSDNSSKCMPGGSVIFMVNGGTLDEASILCLVHMILELIVDLL